MEILLKINDLNALLIASFCLLLSVVLLFRSRGVDRIGLYVWLFFTLLFLSMSLENRAVYLWFDSLVGYPNLAWFIGWGAKILAICFMAFSLAKLVVFPQWLGWLLISPVIIYSITFIGIGSRPEQPVHIVPNNEYELAFMLTAFIYNALACVVVVYLLWKVAQGYRLLLRARCMLGVICGLMAVAFFVTKAIAAIGGYLFLWTEETLTGLFMVSVGLAFIPGAICIPLAYSSNRMMSKLVRPLLWLDDVSLYRDIDFVRIQLDEFCPTLLAWSVGWREVFSRPVLFGYQAMMDIFDRKKIMATYLSLLNETNGEQALHTVRASYGLTPWDEPKRQKAAKLLAQMNIIDDNEDFLQVQRAYQQLGIALRKNK